MNNVTKMALIHPTELGSKGNMQKIYITAYYKRLPTNMGYSFITFRHQKFLNRGVQLGLWASLPLIAFLPNCYECIVKCMAYGLG